tara:strand:+ start:94 stop:783 length:690 start_codon:yes stop_codon:yes gene_type:complete
MSDLTDFFPATGGGSLVSYDPLTLNRVNIETNYLKSKYSYTATVNPSNDYYFWAPFAQTTYGQTGAYTDLTLNSSAFQTIVDITNTGKGGKLICIIGPAVDYNVTVTFKITIDGTSTEIEYTNLLTSMFGDARGVLGGILAGDPVVTTTNTGQIASPFNGGYNAYRHRDYITNSNGFANSNYNNIWTLPTTFDGINQIQFKDTCKVEIKANTASSSTYFNRAGVIVVPN